MPKGTPTLAHTAKHENLKSAILSNFDVQEAPRPISTTKNIYWSTKQRGRLVRRKGGEEKSPNAPAEGERNRAHFSPNFAEKNSHLA